MASEWPHDGEHVHIHEESRIAAERCDLTLSIRGMFSQESKDVIATFMNLLPDCNSFGFEIYKSEESS